MKLVAECCLYAEERGKLAAQMSQPEEKQALETMASAWENAANKWEAHLLKQIDDSLRVSKKEMRRERAPPLD